MTDTTRERRLRRMATRQGLRLIKSRRRDTRALDFGAYWLAEIHTRAMQTPEAGMNLDEIETFLTTDPKDTP